MSSSFYAISLIKISNMAKEQLAIFLLNLSKESLCDFLNESRLINHIIKQKQKMIELIINCYVINSNNAVKLITADTE